jgi:flagellar basal body-associated protein FliL
MTDFSDDELVSAVLDGEATDEETARVAADPELSTRLAELRSAHDAVATAAIDLPADDVRDVAIAAALAASAPPDVVDLQARRRHRRALQVTSIAAAVLVLLGVIGGLIAWTGHTSPSAKTSAAASSTPPQRDTNTSKSSAEGAAAPAPAPNAATTASPPAQAGDLGSFSTADSLVARARVAAAQFASNDSAATAQDQAPLGTSSTQANRSSAAAACGAQPDIRIEAVATLNGQPVVVVVRGQTSPQTVDVYDTSCVLLFSQPP